MILGIISDIQANILALDAVLKDMEINNVDTIICLGDLIGYGPYPDVVISAIRAREIPCTLGSADEQLAYDFNREGTVLGLSDGTIDWTRTMTKPENIEYLKTLPIQRRIKTPYGWLRFFHGTLQSNVYPLDFNQSDKLLAKELAEARCKIIACGKTHIPNVLELPEGYIINPGSVGLSLNGNPGADYALVHISEAAVEVEMRKVPYDYDAVAFDVTSWSLPDIIADAIRYGKMDQATGKSDEAGKNNADKDKKPPVIGRYAKPSKQ